MTAEISKKLFLDADYNLVEKVNSENMRMLSQEEKNKLVACMGELEALDPRKVERIKRIMFQNK